MFCRLELSLLSLLVSKSVDAIDFRNNACTNLVDYPIAFVAPDCSYNPDVLSDVPSMAKRHGYPMETHTLTTKDGYILNTFRILPKISSNRPPVFVQHGLGINSGSWLAVKNISIAFNLADLGYDVWLGNPRGTLYSQKHVNLTVLDQAYWNFTLDTLAEIDIQDQLQLVANVTNKPGSIIYIGHSMGTTLGFMNAVQNTPDNLLIQGIIALAPIVYIKGTITEFSRVLVPILESTKRQGYFYRENRIHNFLVNFCKMAPEICRGAINLVGYTNQLAPENLLLLVSYYPSGLSVRLLKHYEQITATDEFKKFDYGSKGNLAEYGSEQPPLYDLSKIKVPVFGYYGEHDTFYRAENIARLVSELGSTTSNFTNTPRNGPREESFDHADFVLSNMMHRYLYDDMFQIMQENFS